MKALEMPRFLPMPAFVDDEAVSGDLLSVDFIFFLFFSPCGPVASALETNINVQLRVEVVGVVVVGGGDRLLSVVDC